MKAKFKNKVVRDEIEQVKRRGRMVAFRLEPELYERLRIAAEGERRSMSNLLELVVEGWLTGKNAVQNPEQQG